MYKLLFILLFLISSSIANAGEPYLIVGKIEGLKNKTIYLSEVNGKQFKVIDSTHVNDGRFEFKLLPGTASGFYSIMLNKNNSVFIQVIFDKGSVKLHTEVQNLIDSLRFEDKQNTYYYEQERMGNLRAKKLSLLTTLQSYYKKEDTFYKTIEEETERQKLDQQNLIEKIINSDSEMFLSKYLKARKAVIIPVRENKNKYLQEHSFDNFDFSYEPLLRTALLTDLVANYIKTYEDKNVLRKGQEDAYMLAIDRLMQLGSKNAAMKKALLKELNDVFEYSNFDNLRVYLNENYVSEGLCESDREALKLRMNKVEDLAVGKKAPEINMKNLKGEGKTLYEIDRKYTLIVFWSTGCYHCTRMLPELKKLYERGGFEVLAISLDTDHKRWADFNREGSYGWINYCDDFGWRSKIAEEYNVTATPMLFLLNENKVIIAKPEGLELLKEKLKELGILNE